MIAIPLNLEQQINQIAHKENTPVENWVTQKLTELVEDYQDIQAADKVKAELLNGDDCVIGLDEFMERMNALDD